ncbi:hypothetical protein BH11ARM1_BH11ARM1_05000 [soil metagenome]
MKRAFLILLPCLVLIGCSANQPAAPAIIIPLSVMALPGTTVKAIILSELTSGGSSQGEKVPMMVSEDVHDTSGHVIIAKGSPLEGEVTWSRSEGTLGSMMNKPARLKIKFKTVKAVDGSLIQLGADSEDKEFEFNRENTGMVQASAAVQNLEDTKDHQLVITSLQSFFANGNSSELEKPEIQAELAKMADQLGMPQTANLAKEDQIGKLTNLMTQIKSGANMSSMSGDGGSALRGAAMELIGVVGQLGSKLDRTLGGRNIRAYVGTPVEAKIETSSQVKIIG